MNRLLLTTLILLSAVGCERKSSEVVFAVVNGRSVTEADVRNAIMVRARIGELGNNPVKEEEFVRWANAQTAPMIGALINARLLEDEIARVGIEISAEDEKAVLASYNGQLGRTGATVDDLAKDFGELSDAFKTQVGLAMKFSAYERIYWKSEVSDEMVRQYYALKTNELEQAAKIDALARANAEKAYARLQSGEAWDAVAKECSEDKFFSVAKANNYKEWLWVGPDALGIKELAEKLPTMKEGEYTKPMDTFEGMIIVKLVKRNKKLCQLARILFRMSAPVLGGNDNDSVRARIANRLSQAKRTQTMTRLQNAATIEYPMGTNLVYKIWKEGTH